MRPDELATLVALVVTVAGTGLIALRRPKGRITVVGTMGRNTWVKRFKPTPEVVWTVPGGKTGKMKLDSAHAQQGQTGIVYHLDLATGSTYLPPQDGKPVDMKVDPFRYHRVMESDLLTNLTKPEAENKWVALKPVFIIGLITLGIIGVIFAVSRYFQ